MNKKLTYEQAVEQLEDIVAAFEQNTLNLDQLSDKLKEAKELLAFCKDKLLKAETDIKHIIDNGEG